ncbi:glycosyltransferase [Magnetospirillum sp. UT-4]|uniref:glycosyltransferase family 2 protein n=1 Tax=Magnetospirillum sp. UT-4 TaxID=2681467 RepID=UPI0013812C9C
MLPELAPTLALLGLALLVLPHARRDGGAVRVAALAVAVAATARYLVWRLGTTLPDLSLDPAALWMWLLAVVEALATLNAMATCVFLMRRSSRRAEADAGERRLASRAVLPPVDVVIASYNEPFEVLERSILGALALDWPQVRVWVLDDGNRPWLAEYCTARGVRRATRDGNAHGKAGNLNAWLAASGATEAPFILVLDADFVAQPRLLRRVMGFFDEAGVALVQTPQSFFNPDPIQLNLLAGGALADEQRFFYHDFQPSLDAWGAAFCCGTSFVVRRDALVAAGGIPTCTVTEDMMTTYALAARGGRTVYLDEPLSAGLAPEGLGAFVTQRARWCLGTVQALRSPLSPLRARAGWAHRLCFLNAQLFWLAGVPLMLLAVLAPAVFWWTGVPAFLAEPGAFIAHFGPRFAVEAVVLGWLSRGKVVPVFSGLAPLVVAPAAVAAAARGLLRPRGQRFAVTPKGGGRRPRVVHGRLLAWLGGCVAAIALGMAATRLPDLAPLAAGRANAVNLGWSAYALVLLCLAMLVCVEIPRRRREERMPVAEAVGLDGIPGRLVDLSPGGACVDVRWRGGDTATLALAGVGEVPARVVRRSDDRVMLAFGDLGEARDALIRKLYTGPAALPPARLAPLRALTGAARRWLLSEV